MVLVFSYGEVHLQRALTSREAGSMICLEVAWETQKRVVPSFFLADLDMSLLPSLRGKSLHFVTSHLC